MVHIISVLLAEGIPASILKLAAEATGLKGGAKLTTALSAIGPGGMYGGIMTLSLIQLSSYFISEFSIEHIYLCVIEELCKSDISYEELMDKIDKFHISSGLKLKLKEKVEMTRCDNSKEVVDR